MRTARSSPSLISEKSKPKTDAAVSAARLKRCVNGEKDTQVDWIDYAALTPNRRNARTHSKQQIGQIAKSIETLGFKIPILADEQYIIIAGEGRWKAAKLLGLRKVPAIVIQGLTAAKKRALALADNKISEHAGWDRQILSVELPELAALLAAEDLDISITGFVPAEIDQIAVDFVTETDEPADAGEPD
jgi:hypothetical protein